MHNAGFYYKAVTLNGDPYHLEGGKSATCVTFFMTTKDLGNLLNPCNNGELGDLVRRAREMGELTGALEGALPAECAGAVVAANVREDGELIVIAATPAWASRLRYEADTLLEAARSAGIDAKACRIRVSQR